jgi:asparagine synthetase B (glutamine-hydrolysing)
MKSFFLIASKDGRSIPKAELDRFLQAVDRTIAYRSHVKAIRSYTDPRSTFCLYALTNEPGVAPLLEADGALLAVCGDCHDLDALRALRPSRSFARELSDVSGRFSAAAVDTRSGVVAIGNSVARFDSIFAGQDRHYHYVGTQASTLCCLTNGDIAYDLDALYTLISAGFFGTDRTCFRGVTALPPLTTWLFDGNAVEQHTTRLAALKRGVGGLDEVAEECRVALLHAVRPLVGKGPVALSLSGGKDSRMVLLALRRAGIEVRCNTVDRGTDNVADVYVASLLAAHLSVRHSVSQLDVVDTAEGDKELHIDLLQRTATTLRATDGAVSAHDSQRFAPKFGTSTSLIGLGGEIMRGGYAEHHHDRKRVDVLRIAKLIWSSNSRFFRRATSERYELELARWVAEQEVDTAPHDVLDAMYIYFRCGRWVAGNGRGATTSGPRAYPFLDNRLVLAMARAPAAIKMNHALMRSVMSALDPVAADLPLANKHWHDARAEERRRLEALHPTAYKVAGRKKVGLDWRIHFPAPLIAHIRQYCVQDGRIELLSSILDLRAVHTFLASDKVAQPRAKKFVFGLYAACVLTSGDWLKTPFPTAPVRASIEPSS